MPRKNNPTETVERIIAASLKLFHEKGYEKTSMQDIVNESDMSKGAIFYHFSSKEEIFEIVMEKYFEQGKAFLLELLTEMKGLSAKEKLQKILKANLSHKVMSSKAVNILIMAANSPFLTLAMMRGTKKNVAILAEIIREGIVDGSINTEFPDECAEVFFLLYNFWCDPYIFECNLPTIRKRYIFLQHLMKRLDIDILSDELVESSWKLTEKLLRGINKWKKDNQ